jgi:hypothetical protein
MRYVIRERFFHLGEDSDITDEQGRPIYHVDGKILSLRNTLSALAISAQFACTNDCGRGRQYQCKNRAVATILHRPA